MRYADDFIITGGSREQLEEKVLPAVAAFLETRGLRLSSEKTRITPIEEGFDFLGANVRKYGRKLLIKPSRQHVLEVVRDLRELIRSLRMASQAEVIHRLNSKLRSWAKSQNHLVAHRTFRYVDSCIFRALWQWAQRRHPNKGKGWVRKRYYRTEPPESWAFSTSTRNRKGELVRLGLFRASRLPIRRHVKVRAEATEFDPAYEEYFRQRWLERRRRRKEFQARTGAKAASGKRQTNSRVEQSALRKA